MIYYLIKNRLEDEAIIFYLSRIFICPLKRAVIILIVYIQTIV